LACFDLKGREEEPIFSKKLDFFFRGGLLLAGSTKRNHPKWKSKFFGGLLRSACRTKWSRALDHVADPPTSRDKQSRRLYSIMSHLITSHLVISHLIMSQLVGLLADKSSLALDHVADPPTSRDKQSRHLYSIMSHLITSHFICTSSALDHVATA